MSGYVLTEMQKDLQKFARDFAQKELGPIAAEIDRTHGPFPMEVFRKFCDAGFNTMFLPEAYGGQGFGAFDMVLVNEEFAKVDAGFICSATTGEFGIEPVMLFGTEEQKHYYMDFLLNGKLGAFALTEAGAGSDAAAAKTKAVVDGDDYVINGSKCFISNMGPTEGDYVVVIALTEPEKGVKGMSAIVVDRGTPGFTVGKREEKMGIRGADISELIFEDCRVPRSNLVGKEGEGFKIAMMALDGGRIGMAAQALGICEAAIAASVKYMGERVQFGKPIGKNQGLQWYLADMATRTEAAKALILEAAVAADNGQPLSKLAAMCKYYASENAVWVTNKALQIHGGYGYMRDYPIERMYRDARIVPIYEGTSEVQKMVIAREVMK